MIASQDIWDSTSSSRHQSESWQTLREGSVVRLPIAGQALSGAVPGASTVARSDPTGSETRLDSWDRGGLFVLNPVVRPPSRPSRHRFVRSASWEGAVVERFDSYFTAEVILDGTDEVAYAEFDLTELAPDEVALCEPGALFYWNIGHETKDGGQRSRVSVVSFRRSGRTGVA